MSGLESKLFIPVGDAREREGVPVTVLVTGAAGFIGSTLVDRLLDSGERVIGVDSFTPYYDSAVKRNNLRAALPNAAFTLWDRPLEALRETDLRDVRVIHHLAGQPGVRRSWGDEFAAYVRANVTATQHLLELASSAPRLESIVYSSSSSIYGEAERHPTTEDVTPAPVSPYGVTKLTGEHLCAAYSGSRGLPITSLRYFTVYGPRQRPDMAFTRFLTAHARGETLTVFGTGDQVRDFTYVDDIVRANLAATAPHEGYRVYNVAGGSSASVAEVLTLIGRISGRTPQVEYLPAAAGDVRRTGGATDRIRAELFWAPSRDLDEGLTRQWEWIQTSR